MTAAPIVFDLDGTLVHSAPDIQLGVNRVMAARGLAEFSLPEIISFIGNGLPKLTERVMEARGLDTGAFDTIHAEVATSYDEVNGRLTTLYPGVADALARLSAKGHPLGLCTNKPLGPTRDVLVALGMADMFAAVVGGDTLTVKKPDPAPLHKAFDALGGAGVYVGDSEIDAATAEAAGVPFLLYAGGYRKVRVDDMPRSAVFDRFDALPDLIGKTAGLVA